MSNAIIYDSLLVRELARELNAELAGRQLVRARFEVGESSLLLVTRGDTEGARRGSEVSRGGEEARRGILWALHPTGGWIRRDGSGGRAATGDLLVGADTVIASVTAPPDERIIVFRIGASERAARGRDGADGGGAHDAADAGDERHTDISDGDANRVERIIIELITNRWNAVAVRGDGVVRATLRSLRGARAARPGQRYAMPEPTRRAGAVEPIDAETWRAVVGAAAPADREAALVRSIAYTSGLNAVSILGEAARGADGAALDASYARYVDVVAAMRASPYLIGGRQPYPVRLPGEDAEPHDTLLAAFEAAADRLGAAPAAPTRPPGKKELRRERALAAASRALERAERKRDRLQAERDGAGPDAERLRRLADLLLSQLHRVHRGASSVVLDDWRGGSVEVELDPSATAAENADRLYARARKRERAAAALPALIARAAADADRLRVLAERIEAGDADAVREAAERFRRRVAAPGATEPPALPYRTYRTSGGFEVRVGRGSRSNDDLTFHHSAPDDIWLHARQVGGAHVVLRWGDKQANPPARDLHEAAVLAALHSKARTSGTVPVDWTRRKYVRKPRKSKPGLVVVDRAKTVFVEPDESAERRMRVAR